MSSLRTGQQLEVVLLMTSDRAATGELVNGSRCYEMYPSLHSITPLHMLNNMDVHGPVSKTISQWEKEWNLGINRELE
jgi:hypothetical protein